MFGLLALALAASLQTEAAAASIAQDPAVQAAPALTDEQALVEINGVLNSVETLRARFLQMDDQGGRAEGTLFLRRPGRLRFEYDDPTPILIIADGQTVAVEDSDLETVDRAPLRQTPLWWILKENVDLAQDARIIDIANADGLHYLTLEDPEGEVQGRVTLAFDLSAEALLGWYAIDAYGQLTRLELSEIETGLSLNPRLFVLEEPEEGRRGRRGR